MGVEHVPRGCTLLPVQIREQYMDSEPFPGRRNLDIQSRQFGRHGDPLQDAEERFIPLQNLDSSRHQCRRVHVLGFLNFGQHNRANLLWLSSLRDMLCEC